MDMETQIRETLARGYCAPENSHKILDSELINAMTKEVLQLFQPIRTGPCEGCNSSAMTGRKIPNLLKGRPIQIRFY